jgi:gamma-glutamylcyclotransferase (GGCT)/AIG2-like uncharacterized protein YtfP
MHLFVYGSLTSPRRLDEVLGRAHRGERLRARLRDYRRLWAHDYDYPFLVPAAGAWTDGVLVMDLSESDAQRLDEYEEVDQARYERRPVEVEVWGCGPGTRLVAAETYVAGPALAARYTPQAQRGGQGCKTRSSI